MVYPDEATLIARGKHATLSRERRQQIERVQKIAKTIMHLANPLLEDCQEKPPEDLGPITELEQCLKNAKTARDRLVVLCGEMAELQSMAWPE